MILKRLFSKIYTPLAWTLFIQVLFFTPGTSLPSPGIFAGFENFDKVIHFLFFTGFVGLWCYYFFHARPAFRFLKITFFVIWLIAAVNGIVVEYIQFYYIPFRSFDKGDIIADILGASFMYGLCNIFLLKESRT